MSQLVSVGHDPRRPRVPMPRLRGLPTVHGGLSEALGVGIARAGRSKRIRQRPRFRVRGVESRLIIRRESRDGVLDDAEHLRRRLDDGARDREDFRDDCFHDQRALACASSV